MARYYNFDKDLDYDVSELDSIYCNYREKQAERRARAMKRSKLHQAIVDSDLQITSDLIEQGADVNARDIHGNTPLHLAIANMDYFPEIYDDIIKLLEMSGASFDATNNYDQTAKQLHALSKQDRGELATMFDNPPSREAGIH
jgi:ankyrin repeat protein